MKAPKSLLSKQSTNHPWVSLNQVQNFTWLDHKVYIKIFSIGQENCVVLLVPLTTGRIQHACNGSKSTAVNVTQTKHCNPTPATGALSTEFHSSLRWITASDHSLVSPARMLSKLQSPQDNREAVGSWSLPRLCKQAMSKLWAQRSVNYPGA